MFKTTSSTDRTDEERTSTKGPSAFASLSAAALALFSSKPSPEPNVIAPIAVETRNATDATRAKVGETAAQIDETSTETTTAEIGATANTNATTTTTTTTTASNLIDKVTSITDDESSIIQSVNINNEDDAADTILERIERGATTVDTLVDEQQQQLQRADTELLFNIDDEQQNDDVTNSSNSDMNVSDPGISNSDSNILNNSRVVDSSNSDTAGINGNSDPSTRNSVSGISSSTSSETVGSINNISSLQNECNVVDITTTSPGNASTSRVRGLSTHDSIATTLTEEADIDDHCYFEDETNDATDGGFKDVISRAGNGDNKDDVNAGTNGGFGDVVSDNGIGDSEDYITAAGDGGFQDDVSAADNLLNLPKSRTRTFADLWSEDAMQRISLRGEKWFEMSDDYSGAGMLPKVLVKGLQRLERSNQDLRIPHGANLVDFTLVHDSDLVDAILVLDLLDEETREQIEKDLPRTLPEIPFFAHTDTIHSLRKVLAAVASEFESVGYVQGMNFLAAQIFWHTRSENASFLIFSRLLAHPKYNLAQVFEAGLPKVMRYAQVLDTLVERHVPLLAKHLYAVGLELLCFSSRWIVTLFTYSMPFEDVANVWDLFFQEGWEAVFRVCLVLLKNIETEIYGSNIDTTARLLRELTENPPRDLMERVNALQLSEVEHRLITDSVAVNESLIGQDE